MDFLTLARWQFAATISFHHVFPPMIIRLGTVLVIAGGIVPAIALLAIIGLWTPYQRMPEPVS